ncbi:MAG: aryl-sulfate sulfotransferase [Lachnospirales bacterium]
MKSNLLKINLIFFIFLFLYPVYGETKNSDVAIYKFNTYEILETKEEVLSYSGDKEMKTYTNTPNSGTDYIILNVAIKKNTGNPLDLKSISLNLNGTSYSRIEDSFLVDHNFSPLSKNLINFGEYSGDLIFEIPKNTPLTGSLIVDGNNYDINNFSKIEIATKNISDTNIGTYHNEISKQKKIEGDIISRFNSGTYNLKNPLVVVNPYGKSPLTALVMFKTDEKAEIEYIVKGKDEYTNISNTISGFNLIHQLPIGGLYGDFNNEVIINVRKENGTIESNSIFIQTAPLSSKINSISIDTRVTDLGNMDHGLLFTSLRNEPPFLGVDKNGDIRWIYSNYTFTMTLERIKNGNFITTSDITENPSQGSVIEFDILGKIYNTYYLGNYMHHDLEQFENGDFVAPISPQGYAIIDGKNGTTKKIVDLNKAYPELAKYYLDLGGDRDTFHLNTTNPDGINVILSPRNQDMTMKVDPNNNEIKWILSNDNVPENYKKYLLSPIGDIKFPSGQHATQRIADQDNDPNTIDLLIYDNNIARSRGDKNASGNYSRGVHYRVDEVNMTVEKVWSFGEEFGNKYTSYIHGDADYLSDTDNYLTSFTAEGKRNYATVFETDRDNNIVYQVDFSYKNGDTLYNYCAEKMNLYPSSMNYDIFTNNASILNNKVEAKEPTVYTTPLGGENFQCSIKNIGFTDSGSIFINGQSTKYPINIMFLGQKNYISPLKNTYTNNFEDTINISKLESGRYEIALGDEKNYKKTQYFFEVSDNGNTSLEVQKAIDSEIESNFNKGNYTLNSPYIVQDPYNLSPLTALVMFKTNAPTSLKIEIKGDNEFNTLTHIFGELNTTHYVPVYGLFAAKNNEVVITATDKTGKSITNTIFIQTGELPKDAYKVYIDVLDRDEASNDLLFFESSKNFAIDNDGNYRWYFSNEFDGKNAASPIRKLKNGNIAMLTDKVKGSYYASGVYELNYLGKIINYYKVPNAHHEITELPNGNLIVPTKNNKGRHTEEDFLSEIDRTTGEVVKTVDFYEIFDFEKIADKTYLNLQYLPAAKGNMENAKKLAMEDWLHINAVDYIEKDNSIVVSCRNQDMVFKMDYGTNEIKWILSDPEDNFGSFKDKLLKPIGATEFQYGQHAPFMDGDVLYLYDNGNYRAKAINSVINVEDNYSNGIGYKIDEVNMTVEQTWEHGKNLWYQTFTPYIGDIDKIGENHFLINYGGLITDTFGVPTDDIMTGVMGTNYTSIRIVEVKDNKEVFNVWVKNDGYSNNYRASRNNMYLNINSTKSLY